jgi:hypothetical protein
VPQPFEATSATHVESQLVAQQKGSIAQRQVEIVVLEQPTVACTVQQSPLPVAAPHLPLVQAPLQHCALVVHVRPSALQAGPHFPLVQAPLQHCALVVHVRPSALQTGGTAQTPLRQELPLQHCALAEQVPPGAVQKVQMPPAQMPPAQQSAVVPQPPPAGAQPPQVPAVQAFPLQHSAELLHASPRGRQVAQAPAMQNFCVVPQHSLALVQAEPTPEQQVFVLGSQVVPLQQAEPPPPQNSPTAEQCWQTPLLQMFEQQSLASVQVSLSMEQLPHLSL